MPHSLESLMANFGLKHVTRLPRLPTGSLKELNINGTAISRLPCSLPRLEVLACCCTPILRLPALPSCKTLNMKGCAQLQQLPEQLPPDLTQLWCSECTTLEQLPMHLPPKLETLHVDGCTALQQLPQQLPAGLRHLQCCKCIALLQLPAQLPPRLECLDVSHCTALEQLPELPPTLHPLILGLQQPAAASRLVQVSGEGGVAGGVGCTAGGLSGLHAVPGLRASG